MQHNTQKTSRLKINQINPEDAKRAATIKTELIAQGDRIRRDYPFLKHQDLIGLAILTGSLAAMTGLTYAYWQGLIAWYVCVPAVAIFASFTHEIEHDLIHSMYFRKNVLMQNLMFIMAWIARPNTISPWKRKIIHLHHHMHSGMPNDIEERAITNGETWGIKRLINIVDPNIGVWIRIWNIKGWDGKYKLFKKSLMANAPLASLFWLLWHACLAYWAVTLASQAAGVELHWPILVQQYMPALTKLSVAWFAPNILRAICLYFISSNMHYFGDIEDGNVVQQCQVLTHWSFIPFHLFCFNFGSTHAMHHFVVRDPFYLRQLYAKAGHAVMRSNGVRFNDFGTFARANRYAPAHG